MTELGIDSRHGRATGKFAQGLVALVLQVGYANFTGIEAVHGHVAQESEKDDALPQRGILLGVLAVSNQVEDLLTLIEAAFHKRLFVTVHAEAVQPNQTTAERELELIVFTGEQVDKFRGASFDGSAGVIVFGDDRVAEPVQRFILVRRKVFRRVFPRWGRRLLFSDGLMGKLGGLRGNDLQNRARCGTDRQRLQDISSTYALI